MLCQEVLSRMVEKEYAAKRLSGVKVSRRGPTLTHVMYSDDIMLFTKASSREVAVLNECLEKYFVWSGKKLNRVKSRLTPKV
jgi:hypothetical protein